MRKVDCICREAARRAVCDFCRWEGTANCEECEHPIDDILAMDVVSSTDYNLLLKAARAMHTWIFLNTGDELEAYDECGLSDEMNALLGYGGSFTAEIKEKNA